MVCTELFGVITVAFEFIGYSKHRLQIVGSFDKKNFYIVFSINQTHYWNKWVGVVKWVWLQWLHRFNLASCIWYVFMQFKTKNCQKHNKNVF